MNDNQNYFVTRSTSRVLSIPGGKCSIDIFGDDTNGGGAPMSSKDVNNDTNNSEADATLTSAVASNNEAAATTKDTNTESTSKTSMNEAMRNKQRAMGESFDLFGSSERPEKTKPSATKPTNVERANISTSDQGKTEKSAGSTDRAVSSNQFASSATTNSYNVITARPTSRVLQEPGGKSEDFIFG